jgi:hypothetical protein
MLSEVTIYPVIFIALFWLASSQYLHSALELPPQFSRHIIEQLRKLIDFELALVTIDP